MSWACGIHHSSTALLFEAFLFFISLTAVFFGAFGAHKFAIGYQREGFIYLGVSVVVGAITCGAALFITSTLGLIESIMLLTKTPEEFKKKYIDTKTPWF